jgi:hypothetical protein
MTLLSSAAGRYQLWFQQDKHLWAFGCYLLLYNFIHQRLGADTAMNSLPAAIPNRYVQPIWTPYKFKQTTQQKSFSLTT